MMLGKYAITVGKDGRVFVAAALSWHYNVGDTYYVILNDQAKEKEGVYLSYRFDNEIYDGEKLLKVYKVPANKYLRVPPKYREQLSGKCYLIGVGYGIELHNAEDFDNRTHPTIEEIDMMLKELEEITSKE